MLRRFFLEASRLVDNGTGRGDSYADEPEQRPKTVQNRGSRATAQGLISTFRGLRPSRMVTFLAAFVRP